MDFHIYKKLSQNNKGGDCFNSDPKKLKKINEIFY